jgi:predicted LPLAT superfamily acyltransferase
MRIGGMARGYHMANIASAWYVLFYPSIRRRCGFYLRRRFPDRTGFFQRLLDTYWLVRAYATTLVDIQVQGMFGAGRFTVGSPDRDRLTKFANESAGFVLLHAHVGCWQIGMATLRQFSKGMSVVMTPDQHTQLMLEQNKLQLIDPRTGLESSMRMTETLLAGNILVMMGDRSTGSDKSLVSVEFLGARAMLPVAPFRMASATGVPVVVMTAPRVGKRAYEMRMAKVIEVPRGLGRAAASYEPYCRQFAECIEAFVREYPWQFYNFFDMWEGAEIRTDERREASS